MEEVKKMNLPLAGRIQHGEQQVVNNKKRAVEYGYFIPKVKDSNLQFLANRFNEMYNKKTEIPIRIINEEPFSVKRIRHNQGGSACYCMNGETEGKQKVSNVWQPINCTVDCPHRIKQEGAQKPACNKEGILIFMLPKVNDDRIWYMRITSQEAIEKLNAYFKLQKLLGKSVIGDYVVYLKQKEQTTKEGKKFNNFIVDIIKKEDLISNNTIQNIPEKQTQLSTNAEQNVEKPSQKSEKSELNEQKNTIEQDKNTTNETKKVNKKSAKEKKQDSPQNKDTIVNEKNENFDDYYVLVETNTKKLMKEGKPTDYLFANFMNMKDEVLSVAIPPKFAEELLKYDVGTVAKLSLKKSGEILFTDNIEYTQKLLKNVAA